jgi:alkaline phosphatase D
MKTVFFAFMVAACAFAAERRWAGPEYWCNRLQDWVWRDGEIIASPVEALPCRTAHLLTYELTAKPEPFRVRVQFRQGRNAARAGFAGLLVGAGEGRLDYRGAALVHHFPGKGGGILAVVELQPGGGAAFRDMSAETNAANYPLLAGQKTAVTQPIDSAKGRVALELEGVPSPDGKYTLKLTASDASTGQTYSTAEVVGIEATRLRGNVALVSHGSGEGVIHAFRDLSASGGRFTHHPERAFGPVAGTLYTVARGTLKLSAQFLPVSNRITDGRPLAHLETRSADGQWRQIAGPHPVTGPDYYVPFRVNGWDSAREALTRVVYKDIDGKVYHYETRVARDPADQPTVSVAGFTGMGAMGRIATMPGPAAQPGAIVIGRWTPANVWMPFADAVRVLEKQRIDLLAFTGDQVYEGKPTPPDTLIEPKEDFLYKWLLWHWSFRSLTNHIPATVQPDDHDVYHGNIWGWGGRMNVTGDNADGGYIRSPYFVNMVQRMQSGHLPDPYDPVPIENGITTYYATFDWGGVGWAVLEDRKFKTPRQVKDPAEQRLLGEKQTQMLREWGEQRRGQGFKCAISQTIYASLHVGFEGALTPDADTNGFPKVRRDELIRVLRRSRVFILGGDQHLATFSQVGVESPDDGVYQFSVPALGNIFWRWFYPSVEGKNRKAGDPPWLGEFTDGLGNPFRMLAVANPERQSLLGQKLRQRYLIPKEEAASGLGDELRASQGDGYGIARFHKDTRKITVECWPYNADPERGGKQFAGWPATIDAPLP